LGVYMRNFKLERAALWAAYSQRGTSRNIEHRAAVSKLEIELARAAAEDLRVTQDKINALDKESIQHRADILFERDRLKAEAKEAKEQAKWQAQQAVIARREAREAEIKRKFERDEAARMEADRRKQEERERMNNERALRDLNQPAVPEVIPPKSSIGQEDPAKLAECARLTKLRSAEYFEARKALGYQPDPDELKRIWAQCRLDAGLTH
jgi:hypothetical protein